MSDRWLYSVQPDIGHLLPRTDKGRAIDLFGIEVILDSLRSIATLRKDSIQSFASESISKTDLIPDQHAQQRSARAARIPTYKDRLQLSQ